MVAVGAADGELIAAAVAAARDAAVPEALIAAVLREEAALDDDFTAPVAAGRLFALAREAVA
jgi:hypothetical protein